jgi:hypothetical protein
VLAKPEVDNKAKSPGISTAVAKPPPKLDEAMVILKKELKIQ